MIKQKGNVLILIIGLGSLLLVFLMLVLVSPFFLGALLPKQLSGSNEPNGVTEQDSNKKMVSFEMAGEWKKYRNEQLGFELEYPLEKQFEITLEQNKVSFMVPYTENGFTVMAFNNPNGLDPTLWLEQNVTQLYKNQTYKGQPLSARDIREFEGKFYVGDNPPLTIHAGQFDPTLYLLNTNNLEQNLADKVTQSLKYLNTNVDFSINTSLYKNEEVGIELTYLSSATIQEKDDQVVVWQGKPPTSTGTDAPPAVAYVGFSTFKNDQEWEHSFAAQEKLKENATEMKFLGEKTVRLPNAIEAKEYSFESDLGKWQALYVWENKKIYRINYSGQSFFTTILKSVKFF